MCSRGFDGLLAPPTEYVPRRVRHFVNAAAKGGFWEIPAPLAAPGNIGKAPCVLDGLGHLEGLYDVSAPERLYAMPCVFKPSGWVQRRLTPKEWLSLHDVPVSLVDTLSGELAIRGSIGVSMPALVVGHIFRTLWGSLLGGGVSADRCLRISRFGRWATDLKGHATTGSAGDDCGGQPHCSYDSVSEWYD